MRSKTSEELGNMATSIMNFRPVIDGNFLTDYPQNLYRDGKFKHVPLITGFTSDEGYIGVPFLNMGKPLPDTVSKDEIRGFMKEMLKLDFHLNLDTVIDSTYDKYLSGKAEIDKKTFLRQYIDMSTHYSFAAPSDIVAKGHSGKINY